MTIEEMHQWIDIIIDKVGSPYFTDNEKDLAIQRAEIKFVNGFFNRLIDTHNAEGTSVDEDMIYPLIEEVEVGSDPTRNGYILFSDINTALTDLKNQGIGEEEVPVPYSLMYILRVEQGALNCATAGTYLPSRFVRHNDRGRLEANYFKMSTSTDPSHSYLSDALSVYPKDRESSARITLVRYPIKVYKAQTEEETSVNSEMPSLTHNAILYSALEYLGIAIREADFYQMVNTSKVAE
jgi:hypothetical protein